MVYLVWHSISRAIVTTLSGSLLLQVGYFGGLLFLVWRSGCAERRAQRAQHCHRVRYQSQDYREGDE
ncbi:MULTISPECIES: exopolysaccharide production repressor protein [Rhizobium]|uniref:Exopolysaccharide production repressor protein n=1 Tax=Rhizobium aouanii TaxID=3118145 RepID=A0ABU8CIS4_9HYPH|nr:exopolysaccharide production repressor protein [Rhizobium acaciae]MCW1750247.1 exopolysaccharide production repressor protein [Rhizobium acaciae]